MTTPADTIAAADGVAHGTERPSGHPSSEHPPQPPAHTNGHSFLEKTADFDYIIIRGETANGNKFRPSDWCERLHGALRVLGDAEEEVSELVHLVNYEGQKCILIEKQLEEVSLEVYNFFTSFAGDNNLSTHLITKEDWDSLRT